MGQGNRRNWKKRLSGPARLRRARQQAAECRVLLRDLMASLDAPTEEFAGVEPRPEEWALAEARIARLQRRLGNLSCGRPPFSSTLRLPVFLRLSSMPETPRPESPKMRHGA